MYVNCESSEQLLHFTDLLYKLYPGFAMEIRESLAIDI